MLKHSSQRWAVINRNKSIKPVFNFQLSKPSGRLSAFIQGIWSASVLQPDSVVKSLYSDAGSGIIFNLMGDVTIGNETLPEGVIMLPINKQAENIVLSSGALLAGIRFYPAIGYGVLGQHFDKPTLLSSEQDQLYNLYRIYSQLRMQKDNESQIEVLYQWADKNLDFTNVIPDSLEKALECIEQNEALGQLSKSIQLSQRQIERLFKLWLGMTPKHYQRILRIKKTICFLLLHKNVDLADVAQQFGFSDQAHMTREFRTIACTTPGKL
ncbi:helix-turn-helix domain-containing protein [Spartinivicinus poritis]|uniref:Helix-turn-helix domain-containing protein n=1 Tax=Spartinivicinus poritis TaxID=2994640 RepID=A0ABT5UBF4_9GAMM|nr:helix-turn-helix domain-containing protein [Spartinivicinus sp. A2-2]MDE1463716.1 helix-turn-helix domain-containing protein [Spartinivicinus sp. A2-2]